MSLRQSYTEKKVSLTLSQIVPSPIDPNMKLDKKLGSSHFSITDTHLSYMPHRLDLYLDTSPICLVVAARVI